MKTTWQDKLGIGLETTHGTSVAPTHIIKVNDFNSKDNVGYEDDESLQGSAVTTYGSTQTIKSAEVGFDADVRADVVAFAAAGILGDVTTTGTGPYEHTIGLANSTAARPSYTLTAVRGDTARRFPGVRFSEIGISWNADGIAEVSVAGLGWPSEPTTVPSTSLGTDTRVPGWAVYAVVGGATTLNVLSGEVTISIPDLAPVHVAAGSQSPLAIFGQRVAVEGSLSIVVADNDELNRYLNGTTTSLLITLSDGAAAAVTITMSKIQYRTAEGARGDNFQVLDIDFTAEANSTDDTDGGQSPVKLVIASTVAGSALA